MNVHYKIFYFKNRNELKMKIQSLKIQFLNDGGNFIYRDENTKLLVISDREIEGTDAFIFKNYDEILEKIKKFDFNTFGVRSKRKNSMEDNKKVGELIQKNLNKKVNLNNPDLWIYIDEIDKIPFFFTK